MVFYIFISYGDGRLIFLASNTSRDSAELSKAIGWPRHSAGG
jgi:hypothetical protein